MGMQTYIEGQETNPNYRAFHQKTPGSAGYDLYFIANDGKVELGPGQLKVMRTGVHIALPHGCVAFLKTRSSMALSGLVVGAGVIDSDYRGEVQVVLQNCSNKYATIDLTKAIAQMVVFQHTVGPFERVGSLEALGSTERGAGGFGSTDAAKQ